MRIPFGQHRGQHINQIPDSYLQWMVDRLTGGDLNQFAIAARQELDNRRKSGDVRAANLDEQADEILRQAGYGRLARQRGRR